jgi:lysophospholipase L1-like esterase
VRPRRVAPDRGVCDELLSYVPNVPYRGRGVVAVARPLVLAMALVALSTEGGNLAPGGAAGAPPAPLKIALIGDSIGADLAKALRHPGFDTPAGVTWDVTAQPGAGWGEGEDGEGNWPLDVVHGDTAAMRVRMAARTHPSAIVIELGTNDALRASFAWTLNNGTQLSSRMAGTDHNILSVVRLASSLSRCVVLVSPSYYPTSTYGAEVQYSLMAFHLRMELLKEASSAPDHDVTVADWAALSTTHRLAAGTRENWFTPDGLHPNLFGMKALADLIVQTVRSCPA